MQQVIARRFDDWRISARRLLVEGVSPEEVTWVDGWSQQPRLAFEQRPADEDHDPHATYTVPADFIQVARIAACHRNPLRWPLLYRVLWRITHGEHYLMEVSVDQDVHELRGLERSVRRDEHRMHAFVQFHRTEINRREMYLAWYQSDHHTLQLAANFFVDRFRNIRWCIMTPDETASWDLDRLHFGPGEPRSTVPTDQELVLLWQSNYASTFGHTRLNEQRLQRETPLRVLAALPQSAMIHEVVRSAPQRTTQMLEQAMADKVSAADFLPSKHDLKSLASAAKECQGCPLFANATQTVFGDGPARARIVMVGEQPGDSEDIAGQPFVGPAGKLLDRVLEDVGLDRSKVYVTNAVKHFKWTPRGKRRMHSKPTAREVSACRPWLEAELQAIKPDILICLGATACQSLLGRTFKLTERRGELFESPWAKQTMATYHPSAVLRAKQSEYEDQMYEDFRTDLLMAARALKRLD